MYEITLLTKNGKQKFEREREIVMADQTEALVLNSWQIENMPEISGVSRKTFEENQKKFANFAAKFFDNKFSLDEFIHGANVEAVAAVTKIFNEIMGYGDVDIDIDVPGDIQNILNDALDDSEAVENVTDYLKELGNTSDSKK